MAENGKMKYKRRYKPSGRPSYPTAEDELHEHLMLIALAFLLMG